MSKEVTPVLLQSVITDNMRRIRRERKVLQEDVAMAARWVGVMWSSTTVAQIESGTRQLSLDEFLLLPLILRCKLSDLVAVEDGDQPVKLGFNTILDPEAVADLVSAKGPQLRDDQIPMLPGLEEKLDPRIKEAISDSGLEPTLLSYLKVREGARGEAERKAAQTLKWPAVLITALAIRLWNRPMTEERDARAREQAAEGKEARAVRGHVTRQLLLEIQNEHYERLEVIGDNLPDTPVKLKPVSGDERALRNISIDDYESDESVRTKATKPYERWMRFKILEVLEKEGTLR
jgi:transcriptional regulator with XRE-family HTH domain